MYGDRGIQQGDGRRAQRKSVESTEPVTNVITGQSMGRIGNISRTGVMLIGSARPESNAVYQVILPLPWNDGSTLKVEVGLQEQWFEQATSA
ncbi:MAG: PilZ domain-containing protein, partial [Rhodanobacteraceae bacterium]